MSTLLEPLQEAIKFLSVGGWNRRTGLGPYVLVFGQDKLEADAVVSPTNCAGMDGDGALRGLFDAVHDLQRHQDKGSRVPTLFGYYIKARCAYVADGMSLGRAAGPVVGRKAVRSFARSLAGIGRCLLYTS